MVRITSEANCSEIYYTIFPHVGDIEFITRVLQPDGNFRKCRWRCESQEKCNQQNRPAFAEFTNILHSTLGNSEINFFSISTSLTVESFYSLALKMVDETVVLKIEVQLSTDILYHIFVKIDMLDDRQGSKIHIVYEISERTGSILAYDIITNNYCNMQEMDGALSAEFFSLSLFLFSSLTSYHTLHIFTLHIISYLLLCLSHFYIINVSGLRLGCINTSEIL